MIQVGPRTQLSVQSENSTMGKNFKFVTMEHSTNQQPCEMYLHAHEASRTWPIDFLARKPQREA
jgi:hypothetical protein